jgi:hypothetical protein
VAAEEEDLCHVARMCLQLRTFRNTGMMEGLVGLDIITLILVRCVRYEMV